MDTSTIQKQAEEQIVESFLNGDSRGVPNGVILLLLSKMKDSQRVHLQIERTLEKELQSLRGRMNALLKMVDEYHAHMAEEPPNDPDALKKHEAQGDQLLNKLWEEACSSRTL